MEFHLDETEIGYLEEAALIMRDNHLTLAIKQLSAMESILIESVAPVLNPVWAFLFINEIPAPFAVAGAAIIITAVIFRAITATRQTEPGEHDLAQQEHLP